MDTFHGKCSKINRKELANYRKVSQGTPWYCTACSLTCFSDSLFDETRGVGDCSLNVSGNDLKDVNDSIDWLTSTVSGYYKSNTKIAYLNINSIQNKLDEVKELLNRSLFEISFIAETKIDSTFSNNLLIQPGYRFIRYVV